MENFIYPDYDGGSLLNLMSSIAGAFNVKTEYKPLKLLSSSELKGSKNIVLIVIDGLGYEYLKKYGKGTTFNKYLKGSMTSIFPTATTSAIPAFFTGTSSQKHGMVSWFSFLKEFGQIILPLPYITRIKLQSLNEITSINTFFDIKPFFNKIKTKSYVILEKSIVNSKFSIAASGRAKRISYKSLEGFFKQIKNHIKKPKRKYIFAYWQKHDTSCHEYGVNSKKTLNSFKKLDKGLEKFIRSIRNTNTKIIITSDHGLLDVPKHKKIMMEDHPKLTETLSVPICGDNRYAYCFVKASRKKDFEKYVLTKLKRYCILHKSSDFVKKGYFGLERPSKKFLERIGDYIIIMKENYGIYEKLAGEKENFDVGEHGGLSKDEMLIPLIFIDFKH